VEQTQQRSFLRQIISRRRHGGLAAAELARPNPFPLFRVENSCIAALGEHSAGGFDSAWPLFRTLVGGVVSACRGGARLKKGSHGIMASCMASWQTVATVAFH
jgi:hypothetical protein